MGSNRPKQVEMLGSPVEQSCAEPHTTLSQKAMAAKVSCRRCKKVAPALAQAKAWFRESLPVLINIQLSSSDFRKGSISM